MDNIQLVLLHRQVAESIQTVSFTLSVDSVQSVPLNRGVMGSFRLVSWYRQLLTVPLNRGVMGSFRLVSWYRQLLTVPLNRGVMGSFQLVSWYRQLLTVQLNRGVMDSFRSVSWYRHVADSIQSVLLHRQTWYINRNG